MDIEGLMKYINTGNRDELRKLISLKATVGEKYRHPKEEAMHTFATDLFSFIDENKFDLGVNGRDFGLLNDFFLKTLYEGIDN
jgi:hypothetical protein